MEVHAGWCGQLWLSLEILADFLSFFMPPPPTDHHIAVVMGETGGDHCLRGL